MFGTENKIVTAPCFGGVEGLIVFQVLRPLGRAL